MAAIANLPPLPASGTPLLNADGTMNSDWYRFFAALDRALRAVS